MRRGYLPLLRRGDRPLNRSVLERWWAMGILRDGRRVKLESFMLGGRRHTTIEAVERFVQALNGKELEPGTPTPSQVRRAHEQAEAELIGAGL